MTDKKVPKIKKNRFKEHKIQVSLCVCVCV